MTLRWSFPKQVSHQPIHTHTHTLNSLLLSFKQRKYQIKFDVKGFRASEIETPVFLRIQYLLLQRQLNRQLAHVAHVTGNFRNEIQLKFSLEIHLNSKQK